MFFIENLENILRMATEFLTTEQIGQFQDAFTRYLCRRIMTRYLGEYLPGI